MDQQDFTGDSGRSPLTVPPGVRRLPSSLTAAVVCAPPDYLSRIISSHSAHACDGQPLRLHCPRHSTISVQSAFYGSGEDGLCTAAAAAAADLRPRARNRSCSAFTALQVRCCLFLRIYFVFRLLLSALASFCCVPDRSCCRSVRATGSASCPSTTCCLGGTPVPALPNTSMWTTNANQVSPDTPPPFSRRHRGAISLRLRPPNPCLRSVNLLFSFYSCDQLNTKGCWCVREGR